MRTHFSKKLIIAIVLLTASTAVNAATFTDVVYQTRYSAEINALADLGIAQGNGSGNFFPNDFLNRAELLAFAYRAANKVPPVATSSCFTDIVLGMWYTDYVCDAKAQGFVQGYPDGTFKPASLVNRVEGIKMIIEVLDLPMVTAELPKFTDINSLAWYYEYLQTAFAHNLVPSQMYTFIFGPAEPLVRNEMAAIVYNAYVKRTELTGQAASSSSSSQVLVNTESSRPRTNVNFTPTDVPTISSFPWLYDGNFDALKPIAHEFTVSKRTSRTFVASQFYNGTVKRSPHCTLYVLGATDYQYQYFIGTVFENTCTVVATLEPGSYQWQVIPTVSNARLESSIVDTKTVNGTEGFALAKKIGTTATTNTLATNTTHNLFSFTIATEKKHTITVTNSQKVECIILPQENVDVFGFVGPKCNEEYTFPAGNYFMSVQRKDIPLQERVEYSLHLQ
jgi:S-layer homology domain